MSDHIPSRVLPGLPTREPFCRLAARIRRRVLQRARGRNPAGNRVAGIMPIILTRKISPSFHYNAALKPDSSLAAQTDPNVCQNFRQSFGGMTAISRHESLIGLQFMQSSSRIGRRKLDLGKFCRIERPVVRGVPQFTVVTSIAPKFSLGKILPHQSEYFLK